jgi:hypothetical protein
MVSGNMLYFSFWGVQFYMSGSGERLACVVSCVGIAMLFSPLNGFYHAIQVGKFLAF